MQVEKPRPRQIVARLRQATKRPSSVLFFICAIAALWLASIVFDPVHGAGGLPVLPQKTVINPEAVWQDISASALQNKIAEGVPASARTLRLNADALAEVFKRAPLEFTAAAAGSQAVLALPMPGGAFARFRLVESPILEPGLLKQFPEIKSYSGQGIDDPRMTMRCDFSPRGFNALVLSDGKPLSIHPARWDDTTTYVSYYGQDFHAGNTKLQCLVDERDPLNAQRAGATTLGAPVGPTLRTYRLAVAVTQEYFNDAALGGGTIANAVASLNTWLTAVNAIYERELAVRLILVNNTSIIFTAEPDGLTNGDKNTEIGEVRTILQNQVGLTNFDVGHLLSRVPGGGGLANVGVVCRTDNLKGGGVTEVGSPPANYDGVHVFSHELGHQFGAAHSWNGCAGSETSRSAATAWEVGSGFTIMSYGGVCGTDNIVPFRSNTELRFLSGTFAQITSYLSTTSCAVTSATGNNPPTVDAGINYTIPRQTPFTLTASASDPDAGDIPNLTYCWEELDAGGSDYVNPPYDDSGDPSTTTRPLFRAYSPTSGPSRTFPALTYILNYANDPPDTLNNVRPGEELPRIGRTLNFRVTARDNRNGGGGVNDDSIVLTVDGNSGPFLVTAPNTAVTWTGGSTQTVTWSVNNTNSAPINCANVKISLSTDGGNTFPMTLAASTANDGSESVTVPNGIQTSNARIKVQSIGNIFFDIDDTNFTITAGATCPAVTGISPQAAGVGATVTITGVNFTGVNAVKFSNNLSATFTVNSGTQITATVPSGAVGGPLTLSKSGCADAQTSNFAVCSGSSNLLAIDDGSIEFIGTGTYFVNRLTPSSYPATLTHVQVYNYGNDPGGPPLGTPLTILAGVNLDGDANINGTITQQDSATVQTRWAYNTYAIAPITITSGDFVVGFYMVKPAGVSSNLSMDGTAPFAGRSYFSGDGTNFTQDGGSLNYMIRGQYLTGCSVSNTISPTTQDFLASGGSGSVGVNAVGAWTATSNDAWITITAGASGSGNGTVNYSVAVNNTGAARSGTLTIAGQTFTVTEAACAFSISPTSQSFNGAGTGSVSVTTPTGCPWTATSNDSWITITSGSSGSGDGTVNYSVAANNTGAQRSGTLTIAGQTFTVTEAACAFSISPTSRSHAGGTGGGTVDVTTGGGCNWTAASNDAWITVASTCSGSASTLSVDDGGLENAGSGTTFVNRLTPTSYPATLTQVSIYFHNLVGTSGGLPYALPAGTPINVLVGTKTPGGSIINNSIVQTTAATVQTVGAFNTYSITPVTINSGDFVIGFSVASGIAAFPCPRDLGSPQSRSYFSSDAVNFTQDTGANYMLRGTYFAGCPAMGGSGSGTVIYSVAANNTGAARSGTLTIAGQSFTVNQAACTGTISPTSRTHTAGSGGGTVAVTSPACAWTATSNVSWLTVASACSGAASTLVLDNGNITNIRGSGSYYVNRLTPTSYPATLTQVSIYWYGGGGGPPLTTPLTILAGTNTDGDATINNTSFQTTSATVQSQFAFSTYDITPVTINSGDFVIGFFMPASPSYSGALAMEGTAPLNGRSYLSSNGTTFSLDSSFDYMIRGAYFAGCSTTSGTGNGTVIYSVAANNSGGQRSGTLTIAGQTFTVTQATCSSPTIFYADADGDGYGNPNAPLNACFQPAGYVTNTLDCNDTDAAVNPGTAGGWMGGSSANWHAAANWCNNAVPTSTNNVMLPASGVSNEVSITDANVTVNNLTLGANRTLTVSNNRTLTINGMLTLGGGNLIVANGSTLVIGSSGSISRTSGYIIGALRKTYGGAGSFTFPVGTANGYSPVDVNVISGTGDFTIKATQGPQPNLGGPNNALQRYWTLTASGLTANLTFHYLQADIPAAASESSFVIIKYESSFTFPGGSVDANANTATINGVSSFSDWTLGQPNAPTAIDLMTFTAKVDDRGKVLLEWNTGYEVNNLGFHLYRDLAGQQTRLTPSLVAGSALLSGQTPLTAGLAYAWIDSLPNAKSPAIYWLDDVDLNGQVTRHGPFTPISIGQLPSQAQSLLLSNLQSGVSGFTEQQQRLPATAGAGGKAPQPPASSLQTQWQIAAQSGVKLLIDKAGWYRVTQPELVAAGLDVTRDSRDLQLFVDAQEVPLKINGGLKGRLEAGDSIEFYAMGLDTAETALHSYYLINGAQAGRRVAVVDGSDGPESRAQSFAYTTELKPRYLYFPSLKNGDAENWFGPVISSNPFALTMKVTQPDLDADSEASLELVLQGITSNITHSVSVLLNGTAIGTATFDGQAHSTTRFSVAMRQLQAGDNTISLTATGGSSDFSVVDAVRLSYWHRLTADNNALLLTAEGREKLQIDGFTLPDVRVFDITDAANISEIKAEVKDDGEGYHVTVASPEIGTRLLYAVVDATVQRPAQVLAQRPSTWNRAANGADLLIIAHASLISSLQPLKQLRQAQGYSVTLVDVEDLYDEFSYGAHAATAVKDFLTRARSAWKRVPRWVLLAGDASYDPRNYLGLGENDLVPTGRIATLQFETASDEWLGDGDGDGLAEIAIGRLPVRTAAAAAQVVTKLIGYEQSRPDGVLLVADRPDGFNFEAASQTIKGLLPEGMAVTEVYRSQMDDATARQALMSAWSRGPLLVNYAGHGSSSVWRGNLLVSDDAAGLRNGDGLPVVIAMTCLNGLFNDPRAMSLGEALLLAEQGGAVAVWASSAQTSADGQAQMNQEMMRQLFSGPATGGKPLTLGEATKQARRLVTDGDVRRSWVLLGDPTMRLR